MAYICELSTGQRVYLENQGIQTIVTTLSSSLGQQQQASSGFATGSWISPPEIFQTPQGVVIKIKTAEGERYIQIQGSSLSIMNASPALRNSQQIQVQQSANMPPQAMPSMQPMQPMQPMKPMQPMRMGNMEMNLNPMEMRMGNMEMRMDSQPSQAIPVRQFCSQCGVKIQPSDRFCASCGYPLQH